MKNIFFLSLVLLFLSSCQEEEDPLCDDITCENGGDCLDGTCNCPEMWQGEFCTEQKTPLTISVDALKLTSFPEKNSSGEDWDTGNDGDARPDIYFIVENGNGSLFRSSTLENRSSSAEWTGLNLKIDEVDFTRSLSIIVFDEDQSGDNDAMTTFSVRLYDSNNGFPEAHLLSEDNGNYRCSVEVSYNY